MTDQMYDEADGAGGVVEPGTGNDGFLSALSEGNRDFAAANGWETADGLLESYRNLQDSLSTSLRLPGEDASAEDRAAFYADISKSWTPKDGYRFTLPESLPESFPYDQDFAGEAGEWFREAGLPPEAAQLLHDKWVGKMAGQFAEHQEAAQEAAQQQAEAAEMAHRALVREYGDPDSDGYRNAVAKADRALGTLKTAGVDLTGWFAEKGALTMADGNGLQQVVDPVAVKLLAFIHDSAFAEDGMRGFGAEGGDGNPFESGNPDLRQQSQLLESNPLRARQMIVAAGRDPRLFGL